MNGERDEPDVGSVADEAAKLFGALADWAKDTAHLPGGMPGFEEHLATGAAECTYCPVCRVISAVRGTSPEVRQHLTTAATSLMHAAAGLLAPQMPEPSKERADGGVEKIDLSDDEWEDD